MQKPPDKLIRSRVLLGIFCLNLSLSLSYVGMGILAAQQDLLWRADFSAYYTGWAIVRDGRGADLYDVDTQFAYQQDILQGRSFKDGLLRYIYPPHLTLPFVPLSRFTLPNAYLAWTIGQSLLLVWLLRRLYTLSQPWEPHERWLLLSGVTAFHPLLLAFLLGAHSLLLTLCLLQFYLALKDGRDEWAGIWLIPVTIKPQAVLLPGLLLLAARRWRAVLSAALLGGALALFSTLLMGWKTWTDYLGLLRSHAGLFDAFGVVPGDMHNLKGTLALILGNAHGSFINTVSYLALGAAAVATMWLWRGPWRPNDPRFELRMALTLVMGLLFNVHTNPQDSLLLVIPATLLYGYLCQRQLTHRAFAAFALLCPLIFLFSEFFVQDRLAIRIPVIAMAVLTAWLIKAFAHEHTTPQMA